MNLTDCSPQGVTSVQTDFCMPIAVEFFPGMTKGSRYCGGRPILAVFSNRDDFTCHDGRGRHHLDVVPCQALVRGRDDPNREPGSRPT